MARPDNDVLQTGQKRFEPTWRGMNESTFKRRMITIALAGGLLTGWLATRSLRPTDFGFAPSPSERLVELGATGKTLDQQEINEQYDRIYIALKEARDKARAEHKPLKVLVGDLRQNRKSLLVENLVIRAAWELGIGELVHEVDPDYFNTLQRTAQQLIDGRDSALPPDSIKNLSGMRQEIANGITMPIVMDNSRKYFVNNDGTPADNIMYSVLAGNLLGMKQQGINLPVTMQDAYTHPEAVALKSEATMTSTMLASDQSQVGIFSGIHIPEMARELKEKGAVVLVIDGTGERLSRDSQDKFCKQRFAELDACTDLPVIINGNAANYPGALLARATAASLTHQQPKGTHSIAGMGDVSFEEVMARLEELSLPQETLRK